MRYLKLNTHDHNPTYFPILDQLIQQAKSSSETERIILYNLRNFLPQDLSEYQYNIIINETLNYYENYRRRWENSKGKEDRFKSWVIKQTLLKNYFTSGIFVDDIRNPNDVKVYLPEKEQIKYLCREWVIVRSFSEFKIYMENNDIPYIISLGHDLGFNEYAEEYPSGYHACKWLAHYLRKKESLGLPIVLCHSQNPIGKENIEYYWDNFIKSKKNNYNMNQQQTQTLYNRIDKISDKFETNYYKVGYNQLDNDYYTCSYVSLKNDLKIDQLDQPSIYLDLLDDLEEVKRQTRVLFIHAVLNKVCIEAGKLYLFNGPYQASISYKGVLKGESTFYLKDEDGDFTEIFDSENFQQFIDDQYWELYV